MEVPTGTFNNPYHMRHLRILLDNIDVQQVQVYPAPLSDYCPPPSLHHCCCYTLATSADSRPRLSRLSRARSFHRGKCQDGNSPHSPCVAAQASLPVRPLQLEPQVSFSCSLRILFCIVDTCVFFALMHNDYKIDMFPDI